MSDKISFIGRVERINFPKNRCFLNNGEFGILKIRCIENIENAKEKELYSVKGNWCELEERRDEIKVEIEFDKSHEIYGDSYKVTYCLKLFDISNKTKEKRFLKTILTDTQVKNLYEGLKNPIQIIKCGDINTLTSVKGVGRVTAEKIIEKYNNEKYNAKIYSELYGTGITSNMMNKIIEHYKSPDIALSKIKENPYNLVEVDGVGFLKADEIGLKAGVQRNDKRRIIGCVYYILNELGETGKSYIEYSELKSYLNQYIRDDIFDIDKIIQNMKGIKLFHDDKYICLEKFYNLESNIANELKRLMNSTSYLEIIEKLKNYIQLITTRISHNNANDVVEQNSFFEKYSHIILDCIQLYSNEILNETSKTIQKEIPLINDYVLRRRKNIQRQNNIPTPLSASYIPEPRNLLEQRNNMMPIGNNYISSSATKNPNNNIK